MGYRASPFIMQRRNILINQGIRAWQSNLESRANIDPGSNYYGKLISSIIEYLIMGTGKIAHRKS
jgi:hypothetical protein